MLEGWQINSLITLESGQPWTVDDTQDNFSNTGDFTDRWDFFGRPSDFTSGPVGIPYCSGTFETADGVTCTQYVFNGPPIQLTAAESEPFRTACAGVAPETSTLDKAGCYVKGKSILVPPALGTFGSMPRNLFRDSGFRDWDVSLFKIWKFGERFSGQFRAEFFNVLNHPNFANPYGGPNGFGTAGPWNPRAPGLFGCGCATPDVAAGNPVIGSGDARAIQLGFKLMF
jgi:hypothetical protein